MYAVGAGGGSPSNRSSGPSTAALLDDSPIADFCAVLDTTPVDSWQKRCAAFEAVVNHIPEGSQYGATPKWYNTPVVLRHLAVPISTLLRDARSTVVKQSCQLLASLFTKCQVEARYLFKDIMPTILSVHAQTVAVIRLAVQQMVLTAAIPNVPCKMIMPLWMERLKIDKSRTVRDACALYLGLALQCWQNYNAENSSTPYLTEEIWLQVGTVLLKTLRDPSPDARQHARSALEYFRQVHPDYWMQLLNDPDGPVARDLHIQKWMMKNDTAMSSSTHSRRTYQPQRLRDDADHEMIPPVPLPDPDDVSVSSVRSKYKGGAGSGAQHPYTSDTRFATTTDPAAATTAARLAARGSPQRLLGTQKNAALSTPRRGGPPSAAYQYHYSISRSNSEEDDESVQQRVPKSIAIEPPPTSFGTPSRANRPATSSSSVDRRNNAMSATKSAKPVAAPSPSWSARIHKSALLQRAAARAKLGPPAAAAAYETAAVAPSNKFSEVLVPKKAPEQAVDIPSPPHRARQLDQTTMEAFNSDENEVASPDAQYQAEELSVPIVAFPSNLQYTLGPRSPSKQKVMDELDAAKPVPAEVTVSADAFAFDLTHVASGHSADDDDDDPSRISNRIKSLALSNPDVVVPPAPEPEEGPFIASMHELKKHASQRRSRNSLLMQERFRLSGSLLGSKGSQDDDDEVESRPESNRPSIASDVVPSFPDHPPDESMVNKRSSEEENETPNIAVLGNGNHVGRISAEVASVEANGISPIRATMAEEPMSASSKLSKYLGGVRTPAQAPEHMVIAIRLLRAHKEHVDQIMETLRMEMDALRDFDKLLEEPGRPNEDEVLDYFEAIGLCLDQRSAAAKQLQKEMDRISCGGTLLLRQLVRFAFSASDSLSLLHFQSLHKNSTCSHDCS
jgi:archaellum component FlaD/FlaE